MNEEEEVRPAGIISHRELFAIAYRRRWWFILPLLAGIAVAGAMALLITPQYRSTAMLLVASQDVPTSIIASPLTNYADERIAKIRQQILSRTHLVELIREQKLYPGMQGKMSAEDIQALMRNAIGVELVGTSEANRSASGSDTTIAFNLSFTYHDPMVAHGVTDRLTRMFIDEDKRLRTEQASGTAAFLSRRGNEIRDRMVELERKRREIEARYHGALPDQVALSAQAGSALRAELSRIDAESQGIMQQNSLLAARSEELTSTPGPAYDAVRRAEERLSQLAAQFSDTHPDVIGARAALNIERRRARTLSNRSPGSGVIASEIAAGRSRIGTLSQRRAQMVEAISEMEHLTALAPQASYELNTLQRDYDNLKLQYQDIREKQMEAQVAANLQAEDKGERFSVVDPPNVPFEPVEPDRKKLLIAGATCGLAAGLALVVAMELLGGLIHGAGAVQRITGAQPMVVVPLLKAEENSLRLRVRALLPRVEQQIRWGRGTD